MTYVLIHDDVIGIVNYVLDTYTKKYFGEVLNCTFLYLYNLYITFTLLLHI